MMVSPTRVAEPSTILVLSAMPTQNPARSYSPSAYMSGISAVSPPSRAQPASRQPLATPAITVSAVSTSSLPVAK